MNQEIETTVARKPRSFALKIHRFISRGTRKIFGVGIPVFRYVTFPTLMYFAIFYTKPTPTFFELINPFW
jgi:hypothetical protein